MPNTQAVSQSTEHVPEVVTLRLSPEARDSLEWIAGQYGNIPLAEVIRKALSTEKYLLEQSASGSKLLIEDGKGGLRRVFLR
jgi:hypothetical protein